MLGRTKNPCKSLNLILPVTLTTQRIVPGPGAYEPKNTINKTGFYILSNMKSTMSPSFSVPKLGNNGREQTEVILKRHVPGPG